MRQKTFRNYNNSFAVYPVKVGEKYILVEERQEISNKGIFSLWKDEGGVSGNLNREEKKYHGWRGTSNGWITTAHGLREVIKVSDPIIDPYLGTEYQKVTVGKDLKPDVE